MTARMPGTLFAAIATPSPVPQIRIARSASPRGDHAGGVDGDVRVGGVAVGVDADVDDARDAGRCLEVVLEDLLVVETGVVAIRRRCGSWSAHGGVSSWRSGAVRGGAARRRAGRDDEAARPAVMSAERDRAGVGGAEALLGVRPGAAHPGQQVGGGAAAAARPRRRRADQPSARSSPAATGAGERVAERHERVDHRLVADDRAEARGSPSVGGAHRAAATVAGRGRPRRRAPRRRAARAAPQSAPEVPPARSDQASPAMVEHGAGARRRARAASRAAATAARGRRAACRCRGRRRRRPRRCGRARRRARRSVALRSPRARRARVRPRPATSLEAGR